MTPEIFHGVGDYVRDSLGLAKEAAQSNAKVIVQAGVHFMAETDICCTSANAVQVVEWAAKEWGVDRVILIPDEFLARTVAAQTTIGIIAWKGRCEVHERFTAADIAEMRAAYPGAEILAHPECPEDVLAAADFAGSTAAMIDHVTARRPKQVVMITECSMAANVAGDLPDVQFIGPCNLCPYMKRITLENIRDCLLNMQFEVTVPEDIAERARLAVQRMVDLPPPAVPARYDMIKARHHVAVELI
jgi:quinolinate synthase